MVKPDKFAEAYTGKFYKEGETELLSTGLEGLPLQLLRHLEQGPGMIAFVLGRLIAPSRMKTAQGTLEFAP